MAQNRELGDLGQVINVEPSSNSLQVYGSITVGNSTVNATLNATSVSINSTATNTFTVGTGTYFVADGRVGIGNSTPVFKLDVSGNARLGFNVTQGNPNATNILATSHTVISGTGGNYLTFGQYDVSGNYAQWIQSSFTNPTTAVYNLILQPLGGNVGIGTTSPGAKLDVVGGIRASASPLVLGLGASGQAAELYLNSGADNKYSDVDFAHGGVQKWRIGTSGSDNFLIYDFGANVARFVVDTAGEVGINTNSPSSLLHVQYYNTAGVITGPTSGIWAARIVNAYDVAGYNGLSVHGRWGAGTSTLLEAAAGWNGTAQGYYKVFSVLNDGQSIWTSRAGVEGARITEAGTLQFNSGYGSSSTAYGCRAWAAYDGITPSLLGNGGITSVTRSAAGTYTFNLSFTMPDTNYYVTLGMGDISGVGNEHHVLGTHSTTNFIVYTSLSNDTWGNVDRLNVAVFR